MELYKKMIPNRESRMKILTALSFISDKWMIRMQYFIKTGRLLNLESPKRYTEKLQWYKLYYHNPIIKQCSDKYAVRQYIESKHLSNLLNVLYAVYDKAEDINFTTLPKRFVMKLTTGGGSSSVRFVKNIEEEDIDDLRNLSKKWLETYDGTIGREWGYYDVQPKIIFEEILPSNEINDLMDYKFYCFYTIDDANPEVGRCSLYDTDYNLLNYRRKEFEPLLIKPTIPKTFNKMIEYARILSADFPHVRVDLYNVRGKVYFGELTFYTGSGYGLFEPDEFDFILGNQFKLPKKML